MASKEDYLKFMSEVRKVSGVDMLTPDETCRSRSISSASGGGGDAPANRAIGVNDNVYDAVETCLQETSPVPAQGLHP